MSNPVLTFTERGIYCPAGDFYIDPWRPVDRALITHGHADHARPGHRRYLCTDGCAPVMKHRLGDISVETVKFGETRKIGVKPRPDCPVCQGNSSGAGLAEAGGKA